jgi:hypothetical protein
VLDETLAARLERQPGTPPSGRSLSAVAVAQSPGGLTEAFLRVGSKKPQVVARPRRAVLGIGAASPLSDRQSERGPGFCRWLCATATAENSTLAESVPFPPEQHSPDRGPSCGSILVSRERGSLGTPACASGLLHVTPAAASRDTAYSATPTASRASAV